MSLAENLKNTVKCVHRICPDECKWAKPKNPYYQQKRENKSAHTSRSVLSFFLLYKVIFFADAKSDISLAGSDNARQSLAMIFYSP